VLNTIYNLYIHDMLSPSVSVGPSTMCITCPSTLPNTKHIHADVKHTSCQRQC